MVRASRLLAFAGSALIVGGALLFLGTLAAPGATPALTVTFDLSRFVTPTPAYLGTPLAPPSGRPPAEVSLILPVMPVEAPATATPTATLTETPSATPTRTPSPTPTSRAVPPSPRLPAPTARPSLTPTRTPTASPTPSPTASPTPTPLAPDRILIPAIQVDAPVQPVGWHTVELDGETFGQWDVPDGYAAGWHNTSAPPGQVGNTVLNGHHNVEGRIFGDLIQLAPGDEVILQAGAATYRYAVAQIMVLQERWRTPEERLDNARWILPGDDERVTLVTCWPETDNSHRLIVVALPAGETPRPERSVPEDGGGFVTPDL